MPTQTGALNPLLAALSPDQQQTYAQLAQRQAIGNALLQQGLQPMDAGQNAVGGVAYHVSPLNGVSKLLNAYLGNKISMDAAGQQAQLTGQAMSGAFGGAQPQQPQVAPQSADAGGISGGGSGGGVQSFPVATPGQPTPQQVGAQMAGAQPQSATGPLTIPGYTPQQSMQLYATLGPEGFTKLLAARTAPTAATLAAQQGGFDPALANQAQFRKDSYVAPLAGTGILRNPFNPSQPVAFNPSVPDGAAPLFDASGNVAAMQPIQGAQGVMQANAAAKAAGEGSQLPYSGVDAAGNPLPVTNRTAAANQSAANQPPPIPTLPGLGGQGAASAGGAGVPLPGGPVPGGGAIYAAPPMGAATNAEAGARNQQDELSKKWTDLSSQNTQAQSTTSYLQNIKALAPQAALGQQSDRLNYINGLLSLAGSKPATDMVTANNLLDKYSNQITARLSAGGMGTDSARAILQSAYPNAHMDKDAINEAADNLIGANQMLQAKTRVLAPLANARNPTAYNNAEVQFDQAADPRIWQLQNMAAPDQAKFVSGLSPGVAKQLLQNRQVLKGLGALQ